MFPERGRASVLGELDLGLLDDVGLELDAADGEPLAVDVGDADRSTASGALGREEVVVCGAGQLLPAAGGADLEEGDRVTVVDHLDAAPPPGGSGLVAEGDLAGGLQAEEFPGDGDAAER